MVKSTERVCYYETLGLEPVCSMDDIRHAYHELSKIYHPDKYNSSCGVPKDEASAKFLAIKDAYDILKEPHERAFYDSYLQTYAVPEAFNPDLEAAFDNIDFNGYSDSGRGFYKVYSEVFERIYANERAFQERNDLPWGSVHSPPRMGNLDSPYPEVVQFYNYWLNFSSIMDFCWEEPHDEYDLSQVSRRRVKLWSRQNMKARKKAKKEYNNKVRSLAQNSKRLDRRVMQMTAKREEERKREMEEENERRKRLKKEKLEKAAREYEEPEWTKVVERRRKYGDPEEEKIKEIEEWECVVCRKGFRSEKQCRNHEQSKKHLRRVSELIELQSNHCEIVVESMEDKRDYDELDKEEVSVKAKGDEVAGESDEFSDCVSDNRWKNFSEAVKYDEEEEEEVVDEMGVLLAMVAKQKTMDRKEPKPDSRVANGDDDEIQQKGRKKKGSEEQEE
ncbi:DNAJ protein JJJ1 homolog [Rosa rugosa]|uniref:DNAJ protein JJJ1 homolog n=1 Tax=Rosa rugosa TaxID=74645 RepID=UPI002B40C60B|nr:DNAJ protein JJJ1 homolog [Rosa rugosa]